MNSRNSVNENNFVKYTPGLSLNQFEEKERIEIPFDHLYTCYSRTLSEVQRSNFQLAKEIEITTQRSPADLEMAGFSEVVALRDRITDCEREIKILKSLLIHHIDLAQLQGNDVKKKEKHYQAVKQENDTLRARLCELEKKLINQRRSQNPASSATSNSSQQGHHQSTGSQLLLNNNNYTELLIPSSRTNPFLFENDLNNTFRSNNDIKQESGVSHSGTLPSLPILETNHPYHTTAGDDVWYLSPELDPKPEDLIPPNEPCGAPVVEVPRWREKVYPPLTLPANYSSEDDSEIEAIYDAAFEERHQNLNTMELRKLKYHLWHIRELKLVEKLRQRQRDPWGPGPSTSTAPQPREFTILPQPHKDDQLIEIGRSVPVSAFGENIPMIPETEFKLPWIRSSKPLIRSKL